MPAQKRTTNFFGEVLRAARFRFYPLEFGKLATDKVFIRLTSLGNDQYRLDIFKSGDHEFLESSRNKTEEHVIWWEDEETKQSVRKLVTPFLSKIRQKG